MRTVDWLIPPHRHTTQHGVFRWPAKAVLSSPRTEDLVPLGQLAADLGRLGVRARCVRNAFGPAAVRIRRDPRVTGPEAYRLTVTAAGIEITASAGAGAYYGVQTVRELTASEGRQLGACVIDDEPDFARRGVYLDCSRGKVPKAETLKALVERLAHWKLNELQLYIENVFTWRRHPAIGRGYSPFTPEDLLAVQDHCRKHHVRLVGSLSSFGHFEKILPLPAYRHLGEMYGIAGQRGSSMLCPVDPGSIRLVAELYEEFMTLFEAEDFNVCCDETWELGKGRSRRRVARLGAGRVYLEFLKKIHRLCATHGKRMNAWADIVLEHPEVLADLPKDVVMLNWDYHPRGDRIPRTQEITDAGLAAMVCPGTNSWGSHGGRLRMGMENIARFAKEGVARGAEGLLNTDWGDGGHRNMLAISLHNYAYGAAQSWNHRGTVEKGFTERFCRLSFGQTDGTMAEAIRVLGGALEACGQPYANGTFLACMFLWPMKSYLAPEAAWDKVVDQMRPGAIERHGEALGALRWPKPTAGTDPFVRTALEEYALATQLDRAACLRAATIKKLRAGQTPSAAHYRKLVDETKRAAKELKRVWLLGNKPSRLRDNLAGMEQSVRDYKKRLRS